MKSSLAVAVVSLLSVSLYVSFSEARTPRPPREPNEPSQRQVEQIYARVAANCGAEVPAAQVADLKSGITNMLRYHDAIKAYDGALEDCQYGTSNSDGSVLSRWYNEDYVRPGRKLVQWWDHRRHDTAEQRLAAYNQLTGVTKLLVDTVRTKVNEGFDDDGVQAFLDGIDDLTITKVTVELKPTPELYNVSVGVGGGNGYEFYYQVEDNQTKLVFQDFDGDVEFNSLDYQLRDLRGDYTPAAVLEWTRSANSVQATLYHALSDLRQADAQARRPRNPVRSNGERGTLVVEDGLFRVTCSARSSGQLPVQRYQCSFSHTTLPLSRAYGAAQGILYKALDEYRKSNPDSAVQAGRSARTVEDDAHKFTCTAQRAGQGAQQHQCALEAK